MSSGFDASWLRTDGGSDWLPNLEAGLSAVEAILLESESVSYLEAPEGEALLAGVCVLGLVGRDLPVPCPSAVRDFLKGLEESISQEITNRAEAALKLIVDLDRSELAELFGEREESSRSFEGRVEQLKSFVLERREPVPIPDLVTPEPGHVFAIPLPNAGGWALGVVGQFDGGRLLYYLLGPEVGSLSIETRELGQSAVVTWRSAAISPVLEGRWPIVGTVERFNPGVNWPELIWANDFSDKMGSVPAPPGPVQLLQFEKKGTRLAAKKEWVDEAYLSQFPRSSGGGVEIEPRLVADLLARVRAGGGQSDTDWVYPEYEHKDL